MKITSKVLKSNGSYGLVKEPYEKKQHQNQQNGLDLYVDVLDFYTENICSLKLYRNSKGLHFKKDGTYYLDGFTEVVVWVPFQILSDTEI